MAYYSNPLSNLKPLNLPFGQKIKNFYSKWLVRKWTMISSWNLNISHRLFFIGLLDNYCLIFHNFPTFLCLQRWTFRIKMSKNFMIGLVMLTILLFCTKELNWALELLKLTYLIINHPMFLRGCSSQHRTCIVHVQECSELEFYLELSPKAINIIFTLHAEIYILISVRLWNLKDGGS